MGREVIKKNIILLGDGAVGKTSLIRRFVTDQFDDKYITTIGSKATKKDIYLGTGDKATHLILIVWDILGQKGYKYTQALSFGGIEGALLVADLTRRDTLDSLREYWIPSLFAETGPLPMIFLGNKCDLKSEADIAEKELAKLASEFKIIENGSPHFMTSAKTGENVEDAFYRLGETMMKLTELARAEAERFFIDKGDVKSLVDVADYIIGDFSTQFGSVESATPIIKQQIALANLDINNPTKKSLVAFINGLADVERTITASKRVNLNRTKRLYLLNRF